MTDIFNDPNDTEDDIDPNVDHLAELVGDGKKFKTPQDLAKGKVASDRFIEQLQGELRGLRQELNTRLKLEEVVDQIASKTKSPNNEETPPREPDNGQPAHQKTLSAEDVQSLVNQTLTETQKTAIRQTNVERVNAALEEAFGPTFRRTVRTKAAQLGVGTDFLSNLAAEQPNAFLKLMEVEKRPEVNSTAVTAPASSTSSDALSFRPNSGVKRKSYFDDIKRKDPKAYWSPRVQNELHSEAIKQGASFFDK